MASFSSGFVHSLLPFVKLLSFKNFSMLFLRLLIYWLYIFHEINTLFVMTGMILSIDTYQTSILSHHVYASYSSCGI